ncbi:RNA-processing protein [Candidatus Micrarchaeota archaeon]|nr:RNA-processing protein [Candidatus Micrarchaeota archaeon]
MRAMQIVKIPSERVPVIIGKNGEVKREIQRRGNVELNVDAEGEVEISSENSIDEWRATEVVKAIGRGFSPERAFKLFSEEIYLKIIDLKQIFSSDKDITRQKGRVIGHAGKAKRVIEATSDADLCIYGNTIGIIGGLDGLGLAENAVNKLLEGASHAKVYAMLERGRRRMKEERMLGER